MTDNRIPSLAGGPWRGPVLSLVHTLLDEWRQDERVPASAVRCLCDAISEGDILALKCRIGELVATVVERQSFIEPAVDGTDGLRALVKRSTIGKGNQALSRQTVIDDARRMIDTRYSEKLTVRSLAAHLCTPASPLSKAFRRRFGVTIHSYLTQVRVAHGLNLIRTGSKVEAAALVVGYRSRKDFYAAVSKSTGLTPAQFRLDSRRRDE